MFFYRVPRDALNGGERRGERQALFGYQTSVGGNQSFSYILQENGDRILQESGGGLIAKEQL